MSEHPRNDDEVAALNWQYHLEAQKSPTMQKLFSAGIAKRERTTLAAYSAENLMREDALRGIDADVFSGDLLYDEDQRTVLKAYAERWLRAINEHEGTLKTEEEGN